MSTEQAPGVLVRIACADLRDTSEIADLLSAEGVEHGPISSVQPGPELRLDVGAEQLEAIGRELLGDD